MQFTPPGSPPRSTSARVSHRLRQARHRACSLSCRHRRGARRARRPRCRCQRHVPRGRSGTSADPWPRSGAAQLPLLRHVKRSRRQRLAVAGDHHAIPRTSGRGPDDSSPRWPTWRPPCGVRRPRTASTRSGPACGMPKLGRTGTPSTWWRSRPARNCAISSR